MVRMGRLLKVLMVICMLTIPMCLSSVTGILLMAPCFPGSFGYLLFSPCVHPGRHWELFPDWVLRLIFLYLVISFALHLLVPLLLEGIVFSSLHCFCLANYQYLFWRNIFRERWDWPRAVRMYKEIQLLITNYNWIHGGILSNALTIFVSSNFIVAAYVIIALYSEISIPQLLLFSLNAIDCFLAMLLCDGGFKAIVNNVSQNTLAKVTALSCVMRKPIMRRYVKSWPVAKIKLGSTNFYDRETPLNLIQFCISQVVGLLLI